jgi:hypothetical protein
MEFHNLHSLSAERPSWEIRHVKEPLWLMEEESKNLAGSLLFRVLTWYPAKRRKQPPTDAVLRRSAREDRDIGSSGGSNLKSLWL